MKNLKTRLAYKLLPITIILAIILGIGCKKVIDEKNCKAEIDEFNRLDKRKNEIVVEFRDVLPPTIQGIEEIYWRYFNDMFVHGDYSNTVDDTIRGHKEMCRALVGDPLYPNDPALPQQIINLADSNELYIEPLKKALLAKEACLNNE